MIRRLLHLMLEAENLSYFHDIVTDAFLSEVAQVGSGLVDWVPWLEQAILSYEAIYSLHPGMQCTRKTCEAIHASRRRASGAPRRLTQYHY